MTRLTLLLLTLPLTCTTALAADRIYWDSFDPPCVSLPGVLTSQGVMPYSSWAGVPFGSLHTWVWGNASNTFTDSGNLLSVGVKSYTFTAPPEGSGGKINFPSTTAGVSVSLGERCGIWDGLPLACIGVGSSAIQWTTVKGSPTFKCYLEPGSVYYLNYAWFIWTDYLNDANSRSTSCKCPGVTCMYDTATCQFGNNSTP